MTTHISKGVDKAVKHTPGPWEAKLARLVNDAPIAGFYISADGKLPMVAGVGVSEKYRAIVDGSQLERDWRNAFPDEAKKYFTCEEAEANAHLIAAAPELLEALKAILLKLDQNRFCFQIPAEEKLALAAIAKAEAQ